MKAKSVIFFWVALGALSSPALTCYVDSVALTYVAHDGNGTATIGDGSTVAINPTTVVALTIPATIYRSSNSTTYTVTGIAANAFNGCRSLTAVVIPPGVTNIGKQAFYDCTGLSSVQFPRGLKTIGEYAFSNTSSLTNLFLPAHVETVGASIFGAKKDNATYYAPVALRAGGKLNKYDPIYYGYGSEEGYGTLAFDEHETFKVVAFRLLGPNEFFFTIEGTPKDGAKAENLMAQQLGVLRDKTLGSLATAPFGIDDIRDFVAEDLPDGRIRASFRLVIPASEVSDLMFFKVAAENPD